MQNKMNDMVLDDPEGHLAQCVIIHEKGETEQMLITQGLKSNVVCSTLKELEIEALCDSMQYYKFEKDQIICHQGLNGSYFFIIAEGEFDVYINAKYVSKLKRGKTFGEIALIHNTPRSATVKVGSATAYAWGVQRKTFRDILRQLSSRNYAENRRFIESVKILEMLTEAQKTMITNALTPEAFVEGTVMVREGEQGDILYIIKEGKAKVTIGQKFIRELERGDYFGERALLYDEPRSATVTTCSSMKVLTIARELLTTILGNLQHVLFHNVMVIAVKNSKTFSKFTETQIDSLLQAVAVKDYPENYTIIDREVRARDVRFFMILEGDVLVSKDGKPMTTLSRGQSFGDLYIKYPDMPFEHRVDSLTATKLALLTASTFTICLGSKNIDETFERNQKMKVMSKIYIFRYLNPAQLNDLINKFEERVYESGQHIIQEGELGYEFFIIKTGEVEVSIRSKKIRTCGRHDYFGERALLYNDMRTATITAVSETVCWVVDKTTFSQLLKAPILKHLEERIKVQDATIKFSDLEICHTIGTGTNGKVKIAKRTHSDGTVDVFALKILKKSGVIAMGQQDHARHERDILAENDHPLIIKLIKTYQDSKKLYFLQELATGGELFDVLRELHIMSKSQAQFYAASLILAIEYLHDRTIIFRDLKPENALLDSQGYIKLVDFGCAKKIGGSNGTYTLIGTPHYMAPEMFLGKGYGTSVDIWAIGVCVYEFICGRMPFDLEDENDSLLIFSKVLRSSLIFPNPDQEPDYVPDIDTENFIKRILARLPEVRLGASVNGFKDIKDHSFFIEFCWDDLLSREIESPVIPPDRTILDGPPTPSSESDDEPNDVVGFQDWMDGFDIIPEE